jgi:hypothetical protein
MSRQSRWEYLRKLHYRYSSVVAIETNRSSTGSVSMVGTNDRSKIARRNFQSELFCQATNPLYPRVSTENFRSEPPCRDAVIPAVVQAFAAGGRE